MIDKELHTTILYPIVLPPGVTVESGESVGEYGEPVTLLDNINQSFSIYTLRICASKSGLVCFLAIYADGIESCSVIFNTNRTFPTLMRVMVPVFQPGTTITAKIKSNSELKDAVEVCVNPPDGGYFD